MEEQNKTRPPNWKILEMGAGLAMPHFFPPQLIIWMMVLLLYQKEVVIRSEIAQQSYANETHT